MEYLLIGLGLGVVSILIWRRRKYSLEGWLRKKPGAPIRWKVVRGRFESEMYGPYLMGGFHDTKELAEEWAAKKRLEPRYRDVLIEVHEVLAEKEG